MAMLNEFENYRNFIDINRLSNSAFRCDGDMLFFIPSGKVSPLIIFSILLEANY